MKRDSKIAGERGNTEFISKCWRQVKCFKCCVLSSEKGSLR